MFPYLSAAGFKRTGHGKSFYILSVHPCVELVDSFFVCA
jgi:hypothetical protein